MTLRQYAQDGTYAVAFEALSDYCFYREEMKIPVITIRISNAITPNGDGLNEGLIIEAADQINLKVYNRWVHSSSVMKTTKIIGRV